MDGSVRQFLEECDYFQVEYTPIIFFERSPYGDAPGITRSERR